MILCPLHLPAIVINGAHNFKLKMNFDLCLLFLASLVESSLKGVSSKADNINEPSNNLFMSKPLHHFRFQKDFLLTRALHAWRFWAPRIFPLSHPPSRRHRLEKRKKKRSNYH
jgi:hypothetical protein